MPKLFIERLVRSCLLLLLGLCSLSQAQNRPPKIVLPDGYVDRYYKNMRYGLFVPPSYNPLKKYPLVIYLHGSTDTTSWDLQWYHDPIQANDPCFVLTPKSLVAHSGWGTSWQKKHSRDMQKTLAVIALIRKEYNIDSDRIYINGTSMGGFGTISALTKEPDLFAAGFSICGGGDDQNIANLVNTPLWLFHGSADPVVSVELSRNIYKAVQATGGQMIRYTEYPGVGHAAWEPAGKEPTRDAWLLAQRKGARHGRPDKIENLQGKVIGGGKVKLSWELPSAEKQPDNQIWYCRIYRDEELIAEVDNVYLTFVDSVGVGTKHDYSVAAVNYFFQESPKSEPLTMTLK